MPVSKKPTAKKTAATTPATSSISLRKPQIRILNALSKLRSKKGLTRSEVVEKAKVEYACCTEYLGSVKEEIRLANDKKKFPSLVSLKLVTINVFDEDGKDVVRYSVTAKGKKFSA